MVGKAKKIMVEMAEYIAFEGWKKKNDEKTQKKGTKNRPLCIRSI